MNIKRCEPAAAFSTQPSDPQFFRWGALAVNAEMDGEGEMQSLTCLSFDDYYRSMHSFRVSPTLRRKPTPIYATDLNAMRKLLVRYMERRSYLRGAHDGPLPGTDAERMERAKAAILADVPRLDALTTDLCRRYIESRTNGATAEWLQRMETEIRSHDTRLRMAREAPAIFVGILYRSYCLSENSVDVGNALGITPVAVRQLLSRFAKVWERMQTERTPGDRPVEGPEPKVQPFAGHARLY